MEDNKDSGQLFENGKISKEIFIREIGKINLKIVKL
jgi:hypothetical protein